MRFLLFFLVLTFSILGLGQQRIVHYTTADGLPHDTTFGIYQDSKGYIWIGTDNGLVKFDGQEFKAFTIDDGLRTNYVIDIAEDSKGKIILATWGGGIHTLLKDAIIVPKVVADSLQKINNVSVWKDNLIVESFRGNYYYKETADGYDRKTLIVNSRSDTPFITEPKFFERPNGTIGVVGNELMVYNGTSLKNREKKRLYGLYLVDKDWKLKNSFPFLQDKVLQAVTAIDNKQYAASQLDSLFIFNQNKLLFSCKVTTKGKEIEKITKLNENVYLLLASDNKGFKTAYLLNLNETSTIDLMKLLNIKSPVSDILNDHEGNIWITTHGDGVYCYLKKDIELQYIDNTILPETDIKDITQVDDKVYVLSTNYVTSFFNTIKQDTFKLNGLGKGLLNLQNEELLVSSIGFFEENAVKNTREIIAYNSFLVDSVGLIIHSNSLNIEAYPNKGFIEKKIILDAVYYKDTLWFGTTVGPYYYDHYLHKLVSKNISGKKISSSQIKKFLKIDDKLWIATPNGLNLINDDKHVVYAKKDGLVDDHINTLISDHRKNIWIGTQNGISVFDGNDFIGLTKENGLLSSYVEILFEDRENNIWIGGDNGVTLLNNKEKLRLESPPLVHITQNNTSFTYHTISYNRSNNLLSEYKIGNNPWTATTTANGIFEFGNFKKGEHSFQFRAKKLDSNWVYSDDYNFSVSVPWHKDWRWGLLLTAIISLLVIFAITKQLQKAKKRNKALKLSINRKLELERELSSVRENVARDFHDDLGNRLARISIFSNLLSDGDSQINENDKELINQINTDADYLFKGTRDFIFSLKSESDYLEEVITYLSDFGEEYFRQFSIDFLVNKDISRNVKLPYYWSKQLVFIFKEAMTNVVKHANCSRIEVSFSYEFGILTIQCEDNGVGFDATLLRSNRGIDNMKRRAEKIGGKLIIESVKEKSTSITFVGKTTPAV